MTCKVILYHPLAVFTGRVNICLGNRSQEWNYPVRYKHNYPHHQALLAPLNKALYGMAAWLSCFSVWDPDIHLP